MAAGRILIVDGIATNRVVMKVKLEAAFYTALLAGSGADALMLAQAQGPDLILLDQTLPDMPGIDLLRRLKSDPALAQVPVVLLAAAGDDAMRQAALAAGAVDVLAKPLDDQLLLARLRNLLRLVQDLRGLALPLLGMREDTAPFAAPGRIGLVFHRTEAAMALRRSLTAITQDHVQLIPRDAALGHAGDMTCAMPDVFVLDSDLSAGGGLRLLSDLRSRAETRHSGICLWQGGPRDAGQAAQAYDLGVDDVLWADMPPHEVALRLSAVIARRREGQRMRDQLHDAARLAAVDPLTGLWNRRYALPQLAAMAGALQQGGPPVAVMVLDIDRFKSVNDRFGHAVGDAVLIAVAQQLRDILPRPIPHHPDGTPPLIARIGGEEFLVALPCATVQAARLGAESLCDGIRRHAVTLDGFPPIGVTISVGLALLTGSEGVADVLERADRALFAAKERGRDRVTMARNVA